MARWKTFGFVGLAVVAIASVLSVTRIARLGGTTSQSNGWNSLAIQSTLAGIRVRELDSGHAAVVFFYDLDNRTDTDYRLSSGPNVVIMSRLQPTGILSSDQQINLDTSAFVPAKNRTRIAVEMSHPFDWPAQRDAAAERQLRQFVADQVAGLQGFVLFDQAARYQIELAAVSPSTPQSPNSAGPN